MQRLKKLRFMRIQTKAKLALRKLRQKAKQLYEEFDEKYVVYHDLRESGLIVTPGIKFGCDFAVYKYGPGVEHAPYMVSVKESGLRHFRNRNRKSRTVGNDSAQTFHHCCADLANGKKIEIFIFKWFKA